MTEFVDNEDRAEVALTALASEEALLPDAVRWCVDSGMGNDPKVVLGFVHGLSGEDRRMVIDQGIRDLLTNLHHLSDREGLDWNTMAERAEGMYRDEWDDEHPHEELEPGTFMGVPLDQIGEYDHVVIEGTSWADLEPDTYRGILIDQGYGQSEPRSVAPAGYEWVPVQRDDAVGLYEFDEQAATAYAAAISSPMPICWGEPDFEGAAIDVFVCRLGTDDQRWMEDPYTTDEDNQKEN